MKQIEDYILILKDEALSLNISISYYQFSGDINDNTETQNIKLYNNFTYDIIIEEFRSKISMKKNADNKANALTWYSENF